MLHEEFTDDCDAIADDKLTHSQVNKARDTSASGRKPSMSNLLTKELSINA